MQEYDLIALAFIGGVSLPAILYFVYWLALDEAKKYVDGEIREVKKDVREAKRQ
jgi:hypothetical protein